MVSLDSTARRWMSAAAWSVSANTLLLGLMVWLHYVAKPYDSIPAIAIDFITAPELQLARPAPPAPTAEWVSTPKAVEPAPAAEPTEAEPAAEPPSPAPDNEIQPLHRVTRIPQFLRRIQPAYPEGERAAGREATVLVEIVIDTRGRVLDADIVKSGGAEFDQAVLDALQESLFTPGYIDDKPVVVRLQIPFTFKLR